MHVDELYIKSVKFDKESNFLFLNVSRTLLINVHCLPQRENMSNRKKKKNRFCTQKRGDMSMHTNKKLICCVYKNQFLVSILSVCLFKKTHKIPYTTAIPQITCKQIYIKKLEKNDKIGHKMRKQ